MMLSGPKEEQTLQLDALVCGYEDFCDFDTEQVVLIEPFAQFQNHSIYGMVVATLARQCISAGRFRGLRRAVIGSSKFSRSKNN